MKVCRNGFSAAWVVLALSLCADQMPDSKHVFSMSCKVTACNGDLASREGHAKAVSWWKKYGFTNKITWKSFSNSR